MNILVVDDEPDIRTLFEQRFRREIRSGDVTLAFAHSSEEALRYLKDPATEVVFILSDINMPGISGLELLRRIRLERPSAPPCILMLSAYGDADTHDQAMRLGANEFLTKPVDFAALKARLQQLLPSSSATSAKES